MTIGVRTSVPSSREEEVMVMCRKPGQRRAGKFKSDRTRMVVVIVGVIVVAIVVAMVVVVVMMVITWNPSV